MSSPLTTSRSRHRKSVWCSRCALRQTEDVERPLHCQLPARSHKKVHGKRDGKRFSKHVNSGPSRITHKSTNSYSTVFAESLADDYDGPVNLWNILYVLQTVFSLFSLLFACTLSCWVICTDRCDTVPSSKNRQSVRCNSSRVTDGRPLKDKTDCGAIGTYSSRTELLVINV